MKKLIITTDAKKTYKPNRKKATQKVAKVNSKKNKIK